MTLDRRISLFLAAILIINGGLALSAKTLTLNAEECQLNVPDYWEVQHLTADHVTLVSPDHAKFFALQVGKKTPNTTLDDSSFLSGVEKTFVSNGFTVTARKKDSLCGYSARIFEIAKVRPGKTLYGREMIVMANARVYILYTSTTGYPAIEDDELNAIVNSFAFIGRSHIPH